MALWVVRRWQVEYPSFDTIKIEKYESEVAGVYKLIVN